jgi:intein/homing endonuclease
MDSLKYDYIWFSRDELKLKYHRNFETIEKKAQSLKIRRWRRPYDLVLTLKELSDLYSDGFTIGDLAKICNCGKTKIYGWLKKSTVKPRTSETANRTYRINDTFFDVIDTEEKAYFLGFLYADGYNNVKQGKVVISLQERDCYILTKFAEILYSTYRPLYKRKLVKNHQQQLSLCIANKKISKQLEKLGCVQKKSLVLEFPDIPEHVQNHFIRGYFDGDGCIYINKANQAHFNVVGTVAFLTSMQAILMDKCRLNKTKISLKNTIHDFDYCGNLSCLRLREYLYKDATLFLTRKHNKFHSIRNPEKQRSAESEVLNQVSSLEIES